jgi:hypothetical protein
MNRQFFALACLAFGVSLLAACASNQGFGSTTEPPAFTKVSGLSSIVPAKKCLGSDGVRVSPCNVKLTEKTQSGVVVTVGGGDVTGAKVVNGGECYGSKGICSIQHIGHSNSLHYRVASGPSCGKTTVTFEAFQNERWQGYAYLEVRNKYCPS